MNKHIYYNNKSIVISELVTEITHNQVIVNWRELDEKKLKDVLSQFLKETDDKDLFVVSTEIEKTFNTLKKQFYFIEAAGGLIQKDNQYLFIKRLGKWDLPKGKLDEDETPELAAVRECEEECAVKDLVIKKALPNTYHIYGFKKSFALKVTYWYHMQTSYNKTLKPQTEENIEEVKWMNIDEIKSTALTNTYITISDLVKHFFKL